MSSINPFVLSGNMTISALFNELRARKFMVYHPEMDTYEFKGIISAEELSEITRKVLGG